HILLRAIDEMDEDAAALDMAQKAVAETLALMRALDKAGNIGEHEAASVEGDDAEAGCQGGEGIVGDLGFCRAHGGKEGALARIGQADESRIGDELEAQPDPFFLTRLAGIG